MIKTAIENKQNLVVEGFYIPFDWEKDFEKEYLTHIKYCCLVMSEKYIKNHFNNIKSYANVIEDRIDDSDCMVESVIEDNQKMLKMCQLHGLKDILIDEYQSCGI